MRRAACALAALLLAAGAANGEDAGPPGGRPLFRWPLIGKVAKGSDGRGLDIVAPEGEPVHAAGDGIVLYAGDELKSFGKMIVIRHADDYATAYAYLSELTVDQGVKVKRGQIIGKSGKTGDAPRAELHFELRKGGSNVDPVGYFGAPLDRGTPIARRYAACLLATTAGFFSTTAASASEAALCSQRCRRASTPFSVDITSNMARGGHSLTSAGLPLARR